MWSTGLEHDLTLKFILLYSILFIHKLKNGNLQNYLNETVISNNIKKQLQGYICNKSSKAQNFLLHKKLIEFNEVVVDLKFQILAISTTTENVEFSELRIRPKRLLSYRFHHKSIRNRQFQ